MCGVVCVCVCECVVWCGVVCALSSHIQDIVKNYEQRGIPLDVLVTDMDWHKTFYKEAACGGERPSKPDNRVDRVHLGPSSLSTAQEVLGLVGGRTGTDYGEDVTLSVPSSPSSPPCPVLSLPAPLSHALLVLTGASPTG